MLLLRSAFLPSLSVLHSQTLLSEKECCVCEVSRQTSAKKERGQAFGQSWTNA